MKFYDTFFLWTLWHWTTMLMLQFFNKISKFILYMSLFWLVIYFILIKNINHSKIMYMNIKCKIFNTFYNLLWWKELKSNWYVLTVQIHQPSYHLGSQGSYAQKIAHTYRDRQRSGKFGSSKQIKVQRIRPGSSNGSFVRGAWWDRVLAESEDRDTSIK
jgi:hypothetical protein